MDAAGVIESVGPGVERLRVGDEVMAAVMPRRPDGGAQAALLVVPAASVVAIPDGATFAQAATLPMNGLTALRGLELLEPARGRHGCGDRRRRTARLLRHPTRQGAGVARDRRRETRRRDAGPLVRRRHHRPSGRAVRRRGARRLRRTGSTGCTTPRCCTMRSTARSGPAARWSSCADGSPSQTEREIAVKQVAVSAVLERTDWLEQLRELASAGRIALRVADEYPPERVAEAQQRMDAGGLRGRIVIVF